MKNHWVLVLLILALAAFFRFWDLKSAPPGLWADEAVNGVNALRVIETNPPAGGWKVFYPENFGREGLFINIQSVFVKSFGTEPWVLRLPSAIFGVLTILGLYLMTLELFRNSKLEIENSHGEFIALASSLFLATSFWHINFSRIGFRAIMAPFFLVWSFYFLLKGTSRRPTSYGRRTSIIILAGFTFGLGFHSYIAYRIAPVIALLPLWKFYKNWKNQEAGLPLGSPASKYCAPCFIGLFIFAAFIASLPLLWYYVQNPQDFLGRTAAISIFDAPSPLGQFSENLIKTLGMFNIAGDFNWRHNLTGSPQLWWPVGILFLIGIWKSLKKLQWPYSFVLLWFITMLLPVAVSNESLPHALRAIILIPPAMIFAALGLNWLWENVKPQFRIFIYIFLATAVLQAYSQYFLHWAPNFNVHQAFQTEITEKARWLKAEPKDIKKYVVTDAVDQADTTGTPMSFQPIVFITDTFYSQKQAEKNIYYISLKNLDYADCSQKCEFLPVEYRPAIFKTIKQKIPGLRLDASSGFVVLKNY